MRQVVQVHTIEQWFALHPTQQEAILKNIKMRDRLWQWRFAREFEKPAPLDEAKWVPCHRCEQRGWIELHPRYPGIHPSQVASSCLLKIWNEMKGIPQESSHEANTLFIFDLGSAAHDMLQKCGDGGAWGDYYKKEIDIGETEVAQHYRIEGHADADNIIVIGELPDHPIYEVGVVHEYKTINDNGFQSLKGKPKPQHVQQATIYSRCLNRPIVCYLYLNKNNSNMADFPIPYNPQIWEHLEKKLVSLNGYYLSDTPPPANVDYDCRQCGYMSTCEAYKAAREKKKTG